MSAPDRMAHLAQCEREASAKAYRPEPAQDTRDHAAEIRVAHSGTPGVGVPAPPPDHGADDKAKLL